MCEFCKSDQSALGIEFPVFESEAEFEEFYESLEDEDEDCFGLSEGDEPDCEINDCNCWGSHAAPYYDGERCLFCGVQG